MVDSEETKQAETAGGYAKEMSDDYKRAQAQLIAEAAGTPLHINDADARYTRDAIGSHLAGWFSFQPLWDEVCRTDPDLFD